MSRRKNKTNDNKELVEIKLPKLKEETRHAVLAIVCFALAIFFVVASFGYAGRVGTPAYQALGYLFGTGFYLIPVSLLVLGIAFSQSIRPNFIAYRLMATGVFFLSLLGIISVIFQTPDTVINGGLVGRLIATPLYSLFAYYSLIVLVALIIIALLVI